MPKPGTKQESPISASAEAKATLKRLSETLGIRQIDLLDQAVKAMAAHFDFHGKRLILPLRFNETFSIYQLAIPTTGPKEKVLVVKRKEAPTKGTLQ